MQDCFLNHLHKVSTFMFYNRYITIIIIIIKKIDIVCHLQTIAHTGIQILSNYKKNIEYLRPEMCFGSFLYFCC